MIRGYCVSCVTIPRRVVQLDQDFRECFTCFWEGPVVVLQIIRDPQQTTLYEAQRWG